MVKRLLSVLISSFLAVFVSGGQSLSFQNFSTDKGLSHGTVMAMCQDSTGYIWLATRDGLNRYNGYSFRTYRLSDVLPSELYNNHVRCVKTAPDGTVWSSAGRYLAKYFPQTDSFRYYRTPGGEVYDVQTFGNGTLLVACSDALHCFDIRKEGFDDSLLQGGMGNLRANCMVPSGGAVLIGTTEGAIYRLDVGRKIFSPLPQFRCDAPIRCILTDNDGFWVGTEGEGLYRLGPEGDVREHYSAKGGDLSSGCVRSLEYDTEGNLWIGTFEGLTIMRDGKFQRLLHSSDDPMSLSHNSVRCLLRDTQGGMWAGSYFGGVNYWHPQLCRFSCLKPKKENYTSEDNVVNFIVGDSSGRLWIAVGHTDVASYNPSDATFTQYVIGADNDMAYDIKAIYPDSPRGRVFVGAMSGGLSLLDLKSGKVSPFQSDVIPKDVLCFLEKSSSELYIGTSGGIFIFDLPHGTVRNSGLDITNVRAMEWDSSSRLWAGGSESLRVFDFSTGTPEDVTPEPLRGASHIRDIKISSTGCVWLPTDHGICRYDQRDGSTRLYTSADGLPNNVVGSIEEDSSGRLWISTDFGLCCYNPFFETYHVYGTEYGFSSAWFSPSSSYRSADGTLYFGSQDGVIAFDPSDVSDNSISPKPTICEVGVSGRTLKPSGKLNLKSNENTVTVSFETLNYLCLGRDCFSYRMKGYEKEWNSVCGDNSVTYSNLPSGRYVFQLRSANNDHVWNEEMVEMEMRIRPHWMQSPGAIACVILLILTLIALMVYMILERKDKAHMEEIHQQKVRFFINLLNELKTPLTLITSPLQEVIYRSDSQWARKQLLYIDKNARRLTHIVDQMMDYRKAELGVFKLNVGEHDAHAIVREIWSCYEKYAQANNLNYRLVSEIEGRKVIIDPRYLEMILHNLLSNAFKFTSAGSIVVRLSLSDDNFIVEVKDTGKGFTAEERASIFDAVSDFEPEHMNSGIGLSLVRILVRQHHGAVGLVSEPGAGASFVVSFPQGAGVYSESEWGSSEPFTPEHFELDLPAYDPSGNVPGNASNPSRGRILLVGLDERIRDYLNESLSGNFNVILASKSDEVVPLLKSNEVDVVLIDCDSDIQEGVRLCSRIKQDVATSHFTVLVMSSKTEPQDQLPAFQAGADDYICKPFSVPALSAKIHNIIVTRRRTRIGSEPVLDYQPEKMTFNVLDEEFLRKAIAVVEENLSNEEFSIQEFARNMGMSRSNLHLKLKAITGESALDFVRNVRFREACRLLKEGRMSIGVIAEEVGFGTPSYFSASFKKYFGMLPTEYRKNHSE